MLPGAPARRATWHSVLPRAMAPGTGGESVAVACAPAPSADAVTCPGSGGQLPSAVTSSSGPTGPFGPRSTAFALLDTAQSGLKNSAFLANQPPSLLFSNKRLQPATVAADT